MPKVNGVRSDEIRKQHVERPNIPKIQLQKEKDRLGNEIKTMAKTNMINTNEDQCNESLITLLNGQQDL